MKIGVFGDSFADKTWSDTIWWQQLKTTYNHEVTCFGECGSSLLFSARQIQESAQNFDLVIWALTSPSRISFEFNNRWHHVCSTTQTCRSSSVYVKQKFQVAQDYLAHLHDWDDANLIGKSLVCYLQSIFQNILILPCFEPPLSSQFNLYKLCEWESQFYFPNKTIPEIYDEYQDLRAGHLTEQNHRILARLINNNLKPGVFVADYNNFEQPTDPFSKCFSKLNFK
jgi:hypothetical protein